MKKLLMLISLFFIYSVGNAQDDYLDSFSFDTEPLRSESTPYFSIGAGYTYQFMFMNYDEINKYVGDKLGLDEFEGIMYLSGVHGFTGLVVVPNTRLGFFGVSGSQISEKDILDNGSKVGVTASELYVSMSGFSLDYGFVPFKSLAILPGFNIGWGKYEIENTESPNTIDWNDFNRINMPGSKMNRIKNRFMFVQPQLNIEYAVTNFAMLRLNMAYNLTFDNPFVDKKWTFNHETEMKNVPSKMNANGFSASIGIYLGLFNY